MIRCGLELVLVVGVVIAAAVSGVNGDGAHNSTTIPGGSERNQATFRALIDDVAERENAVGACVETIREVKQRNVRHDVYSFPPANFVPPGAREWCQCIVSNPPELGDYRPVTSYGEYYPVPQGVKDAYDTSFDLCRAQVLDGSNIRTMDICRGMFELFGVEMNRFQVSFCGRLCREPDDVPHEYFYFGSELDFAHDCSEECAREAMPGYCSNTLLEYGNFLEFGGLRGNIFRRVVVNGESMFSQVRHEYGHGGPSNEDVRSVCFAMQSTLGNRNECCNYSKAFKLMRQCCYLNEDGQAVFDCEVKTLDDFQQICYAFDPNPEYQPGYYNEYCNRLRDGLLANPEYDTHLKLYKRRNPYFEHRRSIVFPEALLLRICQSAGYDTVCCDLTNIDLVANCMRPERLAEYYVYAGRLQVARPDEPTSAAPYRDPCHGLCTDERDCVQTRNGAAFCVDCSALLKPQRDGTDAECCEYDGAKRRCVTATRRRHPGVCLREQSIFFIDAEGDRKEAEFIKETGYACSNPRDLRRIGKGCKIVVNPAGRAHCYERRSSS